MRKVNPWVTPFYLGFLGVLIFTSISFIDYGVTGNFYPGVVDFDYTDWLIMIASGMIGAL
jgi:hypothetical protein